MRQKRILLLIPANTAKGGISNYYHCIEGMFSLPIDYMERGARNWPHHESKIKELVRLISDLFKYIYLLLKGNYSLVQTSTSLGSGSVRRDGLYLLIANLLHVKTIVFYRGWDEKYKIQLNKKKSRFFKKSFLKASASIVLSSRFKKDLISWGYTNKIYIETTLVDESIIPDMNVIIQSKCFDLLFKPVFLFLSRTEKEKGVYEAIDAYALLKEKHSNARLIIAGDGFELDLLKEYVKNNCIEDVDFRGFVRGEDKTKVFLESNIFIFPSYSEGMPNAVLEAMAFGLPILATPVGGLIEILKDGESGFFIKEKDVNSIVNPAEILINNTQIRKHIIEHNIQYAKSIFYADKVVKRLEHIFNEVINS